MDVWRPCWPPKNDKCRCICRMPGTAISPARRDWRTVRECRTGHIRRAGPCVPRRKSGTFLCRHDAGFPNGPPTVEAGTHRTVNEGDTATLSGTATDPDGDALIYTPWQKYVDISDL